MRYREKQLNLLRPTIVILVHLERLFDEVHEVQTSISQTATSEKSRDLSKSYYSIERETLKILNKSLHFKATLEHAEIIKNDQLDRNAPS